MSETVYLLALFLGVFLASVIVVSGVQIVRTFLSAVKCPDCGRIMQQVLFTPEDGSQPPRRQQECPFCSAKHIRPVQRGKKLTMYP